MFKNLYKNKKVIVTGNTGFKGAWLCIWLELLGAEVYGISNGVPTEPSIFKSQGLSEKIVYHEIDIRDSEKLNQTIEKIQPDFIFHLAAQPIVGLSYSDPLETLSSNIMGTANVLEAFNKLKNNCVGVFITSDKCYENVEWEYGYKETDHLGGKDIYSASKGAAEVVIHGYYHSFIKNKENLRMSSVRAGNVIGGGDWAEMRLVPDCIRAWSKGEKVEIRSPHATRPWQHVLEPLSGYLCIGASLASDDTYNGESYNFGPTSENSHSVLELLTELGGHWISNRENSIQLNRLFTIIENNGFHEAGLLKLCCDKALAHLKWKPVLDFLETSKFTANWYKEFYEGELDMYEFTISQIKEYCQIALNREVSWMR